MSNRWEGRHPAHMRAAVLPPARPARLYRATRSALDAAANRDEGLDGQVGDRYPVVYGMPFGPWSAHIVQLGPIRIEQAPRQILYELDDVRQHPWCLAAASNLIPHDPLRSILSSIPVAPYAPLFGWSALTHRPFSRRMS